jgi:hypothetical protein
MENNFQVHPWLSSLRELVIEHSSQLTYCVSKFVENILRFKGFTSVRNLFKYTSSSNLV